MTDKKAKLLERMNVNDRDALRKENEDLKSKLVKCVAIGNRMAKDLHRLEKDNARLTKELNLARRGVRSSHDEYLDRVSVQAETQEQRIIDKLVMQYKLSHRTKGIAMYFRNKGIPTKKIKRYFYDTEDNECKDEKILPRMAIIYNAALKSSIPREYCKAIAVYTTSLISNGSPIPGGNVEIANDPSSSVFHLEDVFKRVRPETLERWKKAIDAIDLHFTGSPMEE